MWPVRRPARSHTLSTHQTLAALRIATLGPLSLHELFLRCASPVSAPTGLKSSPSRRSSTPSTPKPTPPAAPVPTTSCPTLWFRAPLDKAIKKLVRPSTANTRRKELVIKTSLPLEVFEDFFRQPGNQGSGCPMLLTDCLPVCPLCAQMMLLNTSRRATARRAAGRRVGMARVAAATRRRATKGARARREGWVWLGAPKARAGLSAPKAPEGKGAPKAPAAPRAGLGGLLGLCSLS